MSTDYRYWDQFDDTKALECIDANTQRDDYVHSQSKSNTQKWREHESAQKDTRQVAAALKSKADMEALIAGGVTMNGRLSRRKGGTPKTNDGANPSDQHVQQATPDSTLKDSLRIDSMNTLAELVATISDALTFVLQKVERLQTMARSAHLHREGSALGFAVLNETAAFGRAYRQSIKIMHGKREEYLSAMSAAETSQRYEKQPPLDLNSIETGVENSFHFMMSKTLECTALCALNTGEVALALDLSRCRLKQTAIEAEAGSWLLRGLACAAVGCPYLANVHCRRASTMSPPYPGMAPILSLLDEIELQQCCHVNRRSSVGYKELILRNTSALLNIYLSAASSGFTSTKRSTAGATGLGSLFPNMEIITIQHFRTFLDFYSSEGCTLTLDESKDQQMVPNECTTPAVDGLTDFMDHIVKPETTTDLASTTAEYSKRLDTSLLGRQITLQLRCCYSDPKAIMHVIMTLIRRGFYEAQLLYLESMHFSAEVKYHSVLVLVDSLREQLKSCNWGSNSDCEMFLKHSIEKVIACCLVNISMCRMMRREFGPKEKIPAKSSVNVLADCYESCGQVLEMTALEMVELSISILDIVPTRYRKALLLEQLTRYDDAAQELTTLEALLGDESTCLTNDYVRQSFDSVIADYGEIQLVSQHFIAGGSSLSEISLPIIWPTSPNRACPDKHCTCRAWMAAIPGSDADENFLKTFRNGVRNERDIDATKVNSYRHWSALISSKIARIGYLKVCYGSTS